jgi:ribonuclease G
MGGIVIVDFIDMETNEHRNALYKRMVELMDKDRAKHNVLPLTKFGLMQITRQRVRPATEINTQEVCPACNGTGKISSSVVIDEAIERRLSYYVTEKGISNLTLKVSPILGAYLTKGLFSSILGRWRKKYKCKIELAETTDFTVLQNEFYNEKGDKLD